jgi:ribose 1,5-bisphosphokinase
MGKIMATKLENTTPLNQHFGRVIYLVGGAGSGRDTLINEIRNTSAMQNDFFIAKRYITKLTQEIKNRDNYVEVSKSEFANRVTLNAFALHWRANDTDYGIAADIELWLAVGSHVIINGSKENLTAAQQRYPNLIPVWLDVEAEILKERLQARGKDLESAITAKIASNKKLQAQRPDDAIVIDNNGNISDTLSAFEDMLSMQLQVRFNPTITENISQYAQAV